MVDIEVVKMVFEVVFHRFHRVERVDDNVGGEGVVGRGNRPNVQVVDIADMLVFQQRIFHLFQGNVLGKSVEREAQTARQQVPRGNEDDGSDDEADDGIDDGPARRGDDDARNDDSDADERVGDHVEEGSAHVQVVFLAAQQQKSRQSVDDDADARRPRNRHAIDLGGFVEFMDALDDDGTDGHEQDNRVEQRNEHGRFLVTIRKTAVGVDFRELEGDKHQHERKHVAEVVSGIGKQRQRAFDQSDDGLDDDEKQVQNDGKNENSVQTRQFFHVVMVMMPVGMVVMVMRMCHSFKVLFFQKRLYFLDQFVGGIIFSDNTAILIDDIAANRRQT